MKEPMSSRLVQRIAGAWLGLGLAGLTLLCSAEATAASALDTVQSPYDTHLITMRRGNELGQSDDSSSCDRLSTASSTSLLWRGWRYNWRALVEADIGPLQARDR
jgi:hypothetical protein